MDGGRTIVVFGDELPSVDRLEAELPGASVLQPRNTGELARVLTSGITIDLLVAAVRSERDWRVLGIVREGLRDVDLVALVADGADVRDSDDQLGPIRQFRLSDGHDAIVRSIVDVAIGQHPHSNQPEALAVSMPSVHRPPMARIICVLGAGGGVGTTTVAVALALELAERRDSVIVDLDPTHGSIASVMRANPTYAIDDVDGVMHDPDSLDEALPMCLVNVAPNLHLLAGPTWTTGTRQTDRDVAVVESLARAHEVVVVDLGIRAPSDLSILKVASDAVVVSSHDIVVAGRLSALSDAVEEMAPQARHWSILNQVRSEGPSPSSLSAVLGHGWSCEVPWSRRLRKAWNDPLSGMSQGRSRPWTQVSKHLTWIINSADAPLQPTTVPYPNNVKPRPASDLQTGDAPPARTLPSDAPTEEPTHV